MTDTSFNPTPREVAAVQRFAQLCEQNAADADVCRARGFTRSAVRFERAAADYSALAFLLATGVAKRGGGDAR